MPEKEKNHSKMTAKPSFIGRRIIGQLRGIVKHWAIEAFGKTGCGTNSKSSFWVRLSVVFQMISNFRPQLNLNFCDFSMSPSGMSLHSSVPHITNNRDNLHPGYIFPLLEEVLVEKHVRRQKNARIL